MDNAKQGKHILWKVGAVICLIGVLVLYALKSETWGYPAIYLSGILMLTGILIKKLKTDKRRI